MSDSNSGSLTMTPESAITKKAAVIRATRFGSSASTHKAVSGSRYGNDNIKPEASEIRLPTAIHSTNERTEKGRSIVLRTTRAINGIPARPSPIYGNTGENKENTSAPRNAGMLSTAKSLRRAYIATIATKLIVVTTKNDAAQCG